ncbi:hypothetical protein DHEL01_v203529 [Diaporthe helianthi]|uniref:DUF6546 domain-containing protein n=1 Tax=Diaporthe helianthi TaxID=158607 RepID=A0A2P5I6E4_DIAHE|nr:hypothetical protein DHEL01_v203529 [Diaporthe helianthi]
MDQTSPIAGHWATLPTAVIAIILRYVAQEAAADNTLARYAAVNKDWQYLFEQFTFRSLDLIPDDLAEFEAVVSIHSDRRRWLRTASLQVPDRARDGAHLNHLDGGSAEQPSEQEASQAVASLLRLLKKWHTDSNLRLALHLSAPTASSPLSGRRNMLHQSDQVGLEHIVGEVPAIKRFSIRYRDGQIIYSRAIIGLCSKLPDLEELCLQDVHPEGDHHNEHTKHLQIATLTPEFPTTLKRLHVLGQDGTRTSDASRFLVQRLAWFGMATGLHELSITTSGDAADEFFEYFRNLKPVSSASGITCSHWPALRSLTLACSLLKPGTPHAAINRILHQFGMVAMDLPELRGLRLLSYSTRRSGEIDGFFYYVVRGQGINTAICFSKSA